MQRMEYFREVASRLLDVPWAVADGARRAARPVRRAGEELWSSVLDLPWLARDAWKRVELVALGRGRSRLRATLLALVAASAVLLVVPGVRYFTSEPASGGVAASATSDARARLLTERLAMLDRPEASAAASTAARRDRTKTAPSASPSGAGQDAERARNRLGRTRDVLVRHAEIRRYAEDIRAQH
jgi:hypothetical protein